MTRERLESIPEMRRRHRDEFVAILKRAVQETANSSDAAKRFRFQGPEQGELLA